MAIKYNQLTELLLLEGYSEKNYPAHIKLPGGVYGENVLENIYGGFEYERYYIEQASFQTGCGLYAKGRSCIDDLSYMGREWCFENDNAIILCPYRIKECKYNTPLLSMENNFYFCACHVTNTYQYKKSIEYIRSSQEAEQKRLYQEFKQAHNGRVCVNHASFDEDNHAWRFHYNPLQCVNRCYSEFCPVRNRPLIKKKGNVFYDLRVSTKRKDGTLFDGEPIISIEKGRTFLSKRVSLDICEAIVEKGTKDIYEKVWWNGYSHQKLYDPDLQIEILNLRAEARECRDIEQDLQDIKNGIHVVHESDRKKAQQERKKGIRKK